MAVLKGITWNHTRGLLPMVATAQRFTELNPEIEITWEKRSLQEFADASIEDLAKRFDLLVIDHPWTGFGAHTNAILPLSDYLSSDYIKDQERALICNYIMSNNFAFGGINTSLIFKKYR